MSKAHLLETIRRIKLASTIGPVTLDGYRNALEQCKELADKALELDYVSEELCTFGPIEERKKIWIIRFEDNDKVDLIFYDEEQAIRRYEVYAEMWNCTLLGTVSN